VLSPEPGEVTYAEGDVIASAWLADTANTVWSMLGPLLKSLAEMV
jgi:hypothetical protein